MSHDVSEVYDDYRSARMSEGYYLEMYARISRWSTALKILIGLTATGSAFATLTVWDSDVGKMVWGGLAVLAALAADVGPFLGLDDRAQRLREEGVNNRHLAFDLELLMREIRSREKYDDELAARYLELKESTKQWLANDVHPEDQALIRKHYERVGAQYPEGTFFYPWRDAHAGTQTQADPAA